MSDGYNGYLGEIRLVGFNFAPVGWALCNGQTLPISNNEALYTLLGTTYGGDGQNTFALPNLGGRVPVHNGTGASTYPLGAIGGTENVQLTIAQLPSHTHPLYVSSATATSNIPSSGSVLATEGAGSDEVFTWAAAGQAQQPLSGQSTTVQGTSQSHSNMQPSLCLNYIICTSGQFPSAG